MQRIIKNFVELTERVRATLETKSHKPAPRPEFLFTDESERVLIQNELHTF